MSSRAPSQWCGESEGMEVFPKQSENQFAQVENPNQVQEYSYEYEADAWIHLIVSQVNQAKVNHMCQLHISMHIYLCIIIWITKRICIIIFMQVKVTWWNAPNYVSVYPQILTYNNRSVRYKKIMQIGNVKLVITLRSEHSTLFLGS